MATFTEEMPSNMLAELDYEDSYSEVESLVEEWNGVNNCSSCTEKDEPVALEESSTYPVEDSDSELSTAIEYYSGTEDEDEDEDTLQQRIKKTTPEIPPISQIVEEDSEEVVTVKELLQEWEQDPEHVGVDNTSDDDDVSIERQVILKDNEIDHIVLAAPDLELAIEEFEAMTGVAPVHAHSVKGLGIKCAHVSFNDSSYIEIIAPDHDGEAGVIGKLLMQRKLKKLTPFHFAIRSSRLSSLKKEVAAFGYTPDHITLFSGKEDGMPHNWETMYLYGHKIGGSCPFFIQWDDESIHPCISIPVIGKLRKFHIRAPEDDPIHQLMKHVAVEGVHVEIGDKPRMSFQFTSPNGVVKFACSKAVGFKFPGFDDSTNLSVNDSKVFDDCDFDDSTPTLSTTDLLPIADDHE